MRLLTAVLLISAVSTTAFGQHYAVLTLAGSELGPHDTPGISAALGPVRGIAVDAARNVYMSLYLYNTVVRLDAATGLLTHIAGNGTYGFNGDDGPATASQLFAPRGLAVDNVGNIYIADSLNHRIRKVSGGVITTVAGTGASGFGGDNGPAVNASLNNPRDVAVDSAGDLYIADTNNGRVRKVSNAVITTVAASLSIPGGVAVDFSGNIYFADTGNRRVSKVVNGVITTLAGNGTPGFSGDNGPAASAELGGVSLDGEDVDPHTAVFGPIGVAADLAGNVYIADTVNNRVRKVSDGVITTVAGDGAPLSSPHSIAIDPAGNLYVADTFNNRVRAVSNGVITTLAGTGESRFGGDSGPPASSQLYDPRGVAVDRDGNVYIADTLNNRVRKVSNGVITTVAGGGSQDLGDGGSATRARLSAPIGVALDSAGDLYIADLTNYRVRKVANGIISTVPGTVGITPIGVAVDSAGELYIATGGSIVKVSKGVVSSLAVNSNFAARSVAVDAAGNVYFAEARSDAGVIRKISNGVITTVAGGNSVAVDPAGNVYISDPALNLIRKISGEVTTALPVSPALSFRSWQIAVDSAGQVYCQDTLISRILVLTPTGAAAPSPVSVDTVTNGASNLPLPVAPGEIVTISGSGLGPAQLTSARRGIDGSYDTQLAGTSVQFNGIPAPILSTSAGRVIAVVPYAVTGASARLTVTYQGQIAPPPTVALADLAPGLFTADSTGIGQAAAVNQNGTINSVSTPAPVGSVISLFATGEGRSASLPVSVTIADWPDTQTLSNEELRYVGSAPGEVGILQINVRIPAGIKPGPAVPVFVQIGDKTTQYGVTITVSGH